MINLFSVLDEEDRSLFKRVLDRDESSLLAIYDRYSSHLFGLLMRMIKSVEDAENILHDSMIEIWNRTEKYNIDGGATLYEQILTTIRGRALANDRIKHLKKQSHQPGHFILPIFSEHVLSQPPALPVPTELLQSLIKKFEQLTEEEQQVLALAFYEGWTQTEIAKRLSIPAWTVNWSLRKSLNSIASIILDDADLDDESHPKKYSEACAGHIVGVLQNEELKDFENHLNQGCAICASELIRIKAAIFLLPFGLPQVVISPELKDRIQFSIQLVQVVRASKEQTEEKPESKEAITKGPEKGEQSVVVQNSSANTNRLVDALIVISLIASVALNIYLWKNKSGIKIVSDRDSMVVTFQRDIERKNFLLGVLEAEKIEMVQLNSPKKINFGKLLWDSQTRIALLQVSALPVCISDSTYTLWLTTEEHNINIGNFRINEQAMNGNFFRFQLPSDIAKKDMREFIITLEPEGGIGKPSSLYLLRGRIKN
jgi:RNA polymerase sigma-70 factor, ECF subfamily